MPEDTPNSPSFSPASIKIPFVADTTAIDAAFDKMEERAEKIGKSMGVKSETNPTEQLDAIAGKSKENGLSAADVLAIVGPQQNDPLKQLLGDNHDILERLDRHTSLLESILETLISQQQGGS